MAISKVIKIKLDGSEKVISSFSDLDEVVNSLDKSLSDLEQELATLKISGPKALGQTQEQFDELIKSTEDQIKATKELNKNLNIVGGQDFKDFRVGLKEAEAGLQKVESNLKNTSKSTSLVSGGLDKIKEAGVKAGGPLGGLLQTIGSLGPIGAGAAAVISVGFLAVQNALRGNAELGDKLKGVWAGIKEAAQSSINIVIELLKALFNTFNNVLSVLNNIKTLNFQGLINNISSIKDGWKEVGNAAVDAFERGIEAGSIAAQQSKLERDKLNASLVESEIDGRKAVLEAELSNNRLTIAERQKLTENIKKLDDEILESRIKNAEKELELAERQFKLNKGDFEARKAFADAQLNLDNETTKRDQVRIKNQQDLNNLLLEQLQFNTELAKTNLEIQSTESEFQAQRAKNAAEAEKLVRKASNERIAALQIEKSSLGALQSDQIKILQLNKQIAEEKKKQEEEAARVQKEFIEIGRTRQEAELAAIKTIAESEFSSLEDRISANTLLFNLQETRLNEDISNLKLIKDLTIEQQKTLAELEKQKAEVTQARIQKEIQLERQKVQLVVDTELSLLNEKNILILNDQQKLNNEILKQRNITETINKSLSKELEVSGSIKDIKEITSKRVENIKQGQEAILSQLESQKEIDLELLKNQEDKLLLDQQSLKFLVDNNIANDAQKLKLKEVNAELQGIVDKSAAIKIKFDIDTQKVKEDTGKALDEVKKKSKEEIKEIQDAIFAVINQSISTITDVINSVFDGIDTRAQAQLDQISEQIEILDEQIDLSQKELDILLKELDKTEAALSTSRGERREALISKIVEEQEKALQLNQTILNEKKARADLESQQKAIDKDREKAAKTQAKIQAALQVAQSASAAVAAILAVSQAASLPFPANIPAIIATVAAIGGAIASVVGLVSQFKDGGQLKLEDGGVVNGPSHSQGGVRGTGRFNNIEVEGGEFIINKQATIKNIDILKKINEEGKFKSINLKNKFQIGGQLNNQSSSAISATVNTAENFNQQLNNFNDNLENISNRPTFVSVVDITDAQSRVNTIQSSASL